MFETWYFFTVRINRNFPWRSSTNDQWFFTKSENNFFGHLGDGNLHYNVFGNGSLPDGFNGKSIELTEKLYEIVHKYNGSFSAEHGIGQLRKDSLKKHKNNVAYSLMQTIKNQIDPKGIMNPGKIL